MRQQVTNKIFQDFLESISKSIDQETNIYFTGGITALLMGWRDSTLDIDLVMFPEVDSAFRAFPQLKDTLNINIEIASPAHFVPELPEWRERSLLIQNIRKVSFYHYDLYSQALSKIERGHHHDLQDATRMIGDGYVKVDTLNKLFEDSLTRLYKYPSIDSTSYQKNFHNFINQLQKK